MANTCNCIERINAALAERGASRLEISTSMANIGGRWVFGEPTIALSVVLGEGKKRGEKPTGVVANYCPMCGRKYITPAEKAEEAQNG